MELPKQLKEILSKLKITPESLSEREQRTLNGIFNEFNKFTAEYTRINEDLSKLKFNAVLVSKAIGCTRQTLHDNATYATFLDWCLKKTDVLTNRVEDRDLVNRKKYNQLKEENINLLTNIVKGANKDAEIIRLSKELNEKEARIEKLLKQVNEQSKEISKLRIISYKS